VEIQARDPILDALAQEDVQSLSSISLSSGPSVSDGVSDTGISSENRARRDNYSSSRSSGPARDLEYEALVNDRSHSSEPSMTAHPSPRTDLHPHRQRHWHRRRLGSGIYLLFGVRVYSG
jgi:hypothetical protein